MVNGVKANSGSMDGPGPVIAGGMLYVNSGYVSRRRTGECTARVFGRRQVKQSLRSRTWSRLQLEALQLIPEWRLIPHLAGTPIEPAVEVFDLRPPPRTGAA